MGRLLRCCYSFFGGRNHSNVPLAQRTPCRNGINHSAECDALGIDTSSHNSASTQVHLRDFPKASMSDETLHAAFRFHLIDLFSEGICGCDK
jgi:hypothetical protein